MAKVGTRGQRWGEVSELGTRPGGGAPLLHTGGSSAAGTPAAPRPVCGSEERLPPGEEERARGLTGVHTRARGPQPPQISRGPGSFLHTHTLVYSVLLHLSGR